MSADDLSGCGHDHVMPPPGLFPEPANLDGKFEPEAKGEASRSDAALVSIAVSLKRIADTLDAVVASAGGAGGLANLAWDLGRNMGTGFEQGRR